jgi:hypothetical protein
LAIAGVRLLIYGSGNAPAAGRGGIRDLVIVAEAGDLKQLRSRLSPTERLAVLLADAGTGSAASGSISGNPFHRRLRKHRRCSSFPAFTCGIPGRAG